MIKKVSVLLLLLLLGCSTLVLDQQSTDAFAANDLTLISSCVATPGAQISLASGVDSCHFTVGDSTSQASWTLVVPGPKIAQQVTAVDVDVYYKSVHKTYAMGKAWTIQIPFADLLSITTWTSDFDEGVVEALATISWIDNEGINQITKTRGIAVLVVTASGYDRMQVDSGNQAWGVNCKTQYSTAGRSALQCK
jgi:hypothetical protein